MKTRPFLGLGGLLVALALFSAPVAAASGGYVAADHFQRNVSNGWGQASPGGWYSLQGRASDFWTSDVSYPRGLGYMRVPGAGLGRGAILPQAQAANVELRFSVYVTAAAGDGPYYVYGVARSNGTSEFRARIIYNRDCSVSAGGSMVVDGREQALRSAVTVPGAKWCGPGSQGRIISLRAQISGTNPTTMRIKAWAANGSSEPSNWLWSATTNTALSSGRQSVGLRTYASSKASSRSVDFVFYNWTARAL